MSAATELSPSTTDAPINDSLSSMFVTRIWHIMDLRNLTAHGISIKTGIPVDTLFRLYNGKEELTVDQLARFIEALDVHWMAIFDGMLDPSTVVPAELMNRGVAQLAARLHDMPKVGREMLFAAAARGHGQGEAG